MTEHVGENQIDLYARSLFALLRPGGLLLNHAIAALDPDHKPHEDLFSDLHDRARRREPDRPLRTVAVRAPASRWAASQPRDRRTGPRPQTARGSLLHALRVPRSE